MSWRLAQARLEQAKRESELLLARARHCRLALEVMVALTPVILVPPEAGEGVEPRGAELGFRSRAAEQGAREEGQEEGGSVCAGARAATTGLDAAYPPSQRRRLISGGGGSLHTRWVRYVVWRFLAHFSAGKTPPPHPGPLARPLAQRPSPAPTPLPPWPLAVYGRSLVWVGVGGCGSGVW
jgi:hypothetical protein